MGKIICIGEALLDVADGASRVGGAPANVAACAAKLGAKSVFLGGVSRDDGGKMILSTLAGCGVDVSRTALKRNPTAVAEVKLYGGERTFTFLRNRTADLMLKPCEVPEDMFESGDILHFCSVCAVPSKTRDAQLRAMELAKAAGGLLSFDVNLRPALFESKEALYAQVMALLRDADILKLSSDELEWLFPDCGEEEALKALFKAAPNSQFIVLSKGGEGAELIMADGRRKTYASSGERAVDTTGAGDCLVGALLFKLSESGDFGFDSLDDAMRFAVRAADMSVQHRGAIESYPWAADMEQ